MATISDPLRQAIRDSGISQYELAEKTGVSRSTIIRFLTGQRDLYLDSADKLASFLGLRLSEKSQKKIVDSH